MRRPEPKQERDCAVDADSDSRVDLYATPEWQDEMSRRLAAIEAGTAILIDRDELRERLRARIASA
jgi:hypothetical protein